MSGALAGLSFRDLEYVAAVAQHLHFGRAAKACGVSQPALSAQVLKLERYLGFALFERMSTGTRLTDDGVEFARRAVDLVAAARDLLAMPCANGSAGTCRLGAIPTLGPFLFAHAIRPIRVAFPGLRLLFTEARTVELICMLREGALDAILVCTPPIEAGFEQHELFTEPLLLMHQSEMPPTWPPVRGLLLTLDDEHCLRSQVLLACGITPGRLDRHATGLHLLHQMVAAGEGVSLVPALAAARLGDAGGMVAFSPPGLEPIARDVLLLARRSHPRRSLIAELADVFRKLNLPLQRNPTWPRNFEKGDGLCQGGA